MTDPTGSRPPWIRWLVLGVVAMAVLVVLFTFVFPWIERNLSNPTIGVGVMPPGW